MVDNGEGVKDARHSWDPQNSRVPNRKSGIRPQDFYSKVLYVYW